MTECVVICHQCVDDTGRAKRWHWLCETCAEDCLNQHRKQAGHTDMELRTTSEETFTMADVAARIRARAAAAASWRRHIIKAVR